MRLLTVLLVATLLAGCALIPRSVTRSYLVEVTANVDGELVTGSRVHVGTLGSPLFGIGIAGYRRYPYGDAIKLTVPGRAIYVLMRGVGALSQEGIYFFPTYCPTREMLDNTHVRNIDPLDVYLNFKGSCTLQFKRVRPPQIIEVLDPADPTSIVPLGTVMDGMCVGVCVEKVEITMTEAPVELRIEEELPWLRLADGPMSIAGSHEKDSGELSSGGDINKFYNQDFAKR